MSHYYCIPFSGTLHCTKHFCVFYLIYSHPNPWKFLYHFHFTDEQTKIYQGYITPQHLGWAQSECKLTKLALRCILLNLSFTIKNTILTSHDISMFYSPSVIINYNFNIVCSISMIDHNEDVRAVDYRLSHYRISRYFQQIISQIFPHFMYMLSGSANYFDFFFSFFQILAQLYSSLLNEFTKNV